MTVMRRAESVGCLFIDDLLSSGTGFGKALRARGIPGVDIRTLQCADESALWERLQTALQEIRAGYGACSLMAAGTGCAAALALACQLPVERIVLADPALPVRRTLAPVGGAGNQENLRRYRTARRLAAFARRNLALCVSDILVVEGSAAESGRSPWRGLGKPVNCRVGRLAIWGESAKDLYTIREIAVKEAISRFLHSGEMPKPLAEISEMCIIYG